MEAHSSNMVIPGPVLVAGRYALLNRLGVGGMGEVWRAHDRITREAVAVKVLRPSIAGAPAAELRFQREVTAMARLDHPRVVPVIDAGADPKVGLFFVMALHHGRPLQDVARAWTHWRQVAPLVDQICETLAYAHACGVIHRDIKPDNILIDDNGDAVLLDFGVARLRDHARSGTSAYDMLGTVDYAAPEQATGNRRRIGPWTDLYAFGIVLYEVVCGRLPFLASSPVQSLMIRLENGCPPLDPRPGFVTPIGLWDVLDRLMRPDPFDRIIHAADARAAFAELLGRPFQTLTPADPKGHSTELPVNQVTITDGEAEELLRKRQARYAQNAEGGRLLRPLEPPIRETKVYGRDMVLRQLWYALDRWRLQPQPGVLMIAGPEGSGKSRLALELVKPFLSAAQIDGHRHRWTSGSGTREVVLSVAGAIGLSHDAASEHLHWWLEGHGAHSKFIRDRLVDWALGSEVVSERFEADRFAEFLGQCASRERPFVLMLDGMRLLSKAVFNIVRAIQMHRTPVLVLITTRDPSVPDGVTEPPWLQPATRVLDLMTDEALDAMLSELVSLDEDDRSLLIDAADGSPRELRNAMSDLRRSGLLVPAWPQWQPAPPDWKPPAVQMPEERDDTLNEALPDGFIDSIT